MDDALGVRCVESVGDFDGQIEQRFGVQGTAGDTVLEGLAFEELHDDEGLAVFLIDLVDGADVGMVESRGGAGFSLEAVEGLAVLGQFVRKKFERDGTAEFDVFGAINDSHAATAQLFDDAIVRDSLAEHRVDYRIGHRVGRGKGHATCATILGAGRRQVNALRDTGLSASGPSI